MIRDSALIKVRSAKASDSDALNRVFRDAWRQAYTGIIPPMHLERMIRRRDVRWWRNAIKTESNLLVLEVAGVIAGYASCGAARCGKVACGEIYEIYVAPLYQGAGLGEHLFEACRHQLDLRHFAGLLVWALADNVEAGDFYWRRGGRPIAQSKERFGTTQLAKVAYSFG